MLGGTTAIAEAIQATYLIEISDWLNINYPKQSGNLSICHGDLHPKNILSQWSPE
jgi:aminoglycoside phosphotransferase (APT) family kinase protein